MRGDVIGGRASCWVGEGSCFPECRVVRWCYYDMSLSRREKKTDKKREGVCFLGLVSLE
jgi:hypothetical protein